MINLANVTIINSIGLELEGGIERAVLGPGKRCALVMLDTAEHGADAWGDYRGRDNNGSGEDCS